MISLITTCFNYTTIQTNNTISLTRAVVFMLTVYTDKIVDVKKYINKLRIKKHIYLQQHYQKNLIITNTNIIQYLTYLFIHLLHI